MGMAHRGRLNVLANFMKKSLQMIFTEFSENYRPNLASGDGDVKYHLGYESSRELEGGRTVDVRLASNPSHLEAVDPVVQGKARARQRILEDTVEAQSRSAGAHPRRRGLRRPGNRRGNSEHVATARLQHRRHDSHHRQ